MASNSARDPKGNCSERAGEFPVTLPVPSSAKPLTRKESRGGGHARVRPGGRVPRLPCWRARGRLGVWHPVVLCRWCWCILPPCAFASSNAVNGEDPFSPMHRKVAYQASGLPGAAHGRRRGLPCDAVRRRSCAGIRSLQGNSRLHCKKITVSYCIVNRCKISLHLRMQCTTWPSGCRPSSGEGLAEVTASHGLQAAGRVLLAAGVAHHVGDVEGDAHDGN